MWDYCFAENVKRLCVRRYLASHNNFDGYMCGFHQKMGQNYCELNHITFEKLDELVVFAINQQLKQMRTDLKKLEVQIWQRKLRNWMVKLPDYRQKQKEIPSIENGHMNSLWMIFFQKEEYLELKQIYDNENRQYQKELSILKNEEQKQRETDSNQTKIWLEHFNRRKLTEKQLTRDVVFGQN